MGRSPVFLQTACFVTFSAAVPSFIDMFQYITLQYAIHISIYRVIYIYICFYIMCLFSAASACFASARAPQAPQRDCPVWPNVKATIDAIFFPHCDCVVKSFKQRTCRILYMRRLWRDHVLNVRLLKGSSWCRGSLSDYVGKPAAVAATNAWTRGLARRLHGNGLGNHKP